MAIFNLKKRLIECKIVYYGPGRCGKTTNLEYIFAQYKKQVKGEMVSINTEGDRTLFFDFLPMGLGQIRGCDVRVQLYTVPGQVKYSSTRKLVLRGVDGFSSLSSSTKPAFTLCARQPSSLLPFPSSLSLFAWLSPNSAA